jgi:hypothetical protein
MKGDRCVDGSGRIEVGPLEGAAAGVAGASLLRSTLVEALRLGIYLASVSL